MIVRVGWSPVGADPLPATPRRPLNEVADWLCTTGTSTSARTW